jgi:hypothetical protein
MDIIKAIFGVLSFGLATLSMVGLAMASQNPLGLYGSPEFWAPFVGIFLAATYVLLRRKT